MFDEGKTKLKYPKGRHSNPSRAVDVVPYPIDWNDRERFHLFAGFVLGIAQSMGIKLRWGGDWNMNFEVDDNQFDDFPHFELKDNMANGQEQINKLIAENDLNQLDVSTLERSSTQVIW